MHVDARVCQYAEQPLTPWNLTLSPLLRELTIISEKFVKLYFSSPRVYCLSTFRRHVTGLVITCGLAHNSAKNKWAIEY